MMARSQTINEWQIGTFVLGEHDPSGLHLRVGPVEVSQLGAALSATKQTTNNPRVKVPDMIIDTYDKSDAQRWFDTWEREGERRDLVIRYNRTKQWIAVGEAWILSRRPSGGATLCIEWAKETSGPSLD